MEYTEILEDVTEASGAEPCEIVGNDTDGDWHPLSVASTRDAVEREFWQNREYLRNPEFDNVGAEGYVLWMGREYMLSLLVARGAELVAEARSGFQLYEEMRSFVAVELATLDRMHWAPARDEFGDRCFTSEEFQRRFESMIRRHLESKLLPALDRARSGMGDRDEVRPFAASEHASVIEPLTTDASVTQNAEPSEIEPGQRGTEPNESGGNRRGLVEAYIDEVFRETGKRITKTDIWKLARYRSRTEFERWERNDAKHQNKAAHERFTQILSQKPHLKAVPTQGHASPALPHAKHGAQSFYWGRKIANPEGANGKGERD